MDVHLALRLGSGYFAPGLAKTYVVTFRSHDDDRPSKFIVLADNMKSAISPPCWPRDDLTTIVACGYR